MLSGVIRHQIMNNQPPNPSKSLFGGFTQSFPELFSYIFIWLFYLSTDRASCMYLFIYFGEWTGK